ncbi:transposase [Parapedobacter deserti]|uniref:Transposase n=1 Tax=Parapedobacter deserti TaxID=1912957 RepID=A0ABV7JSH1_9SPHI
MKGKRFKPEQISKILKVFEAGISVQEITREHGVTAASFYKWRQRYGALLPVDLQEQFIRYERDDVHNFSSVEAMPSIIPMLITVSRSFIVNCSFFLFWKRSIRAYNF